MDGEKGYAQPYNEKDYLLMREETSDRLKRKGTILPYKSIYVFSSLHWLINHQGVGSE